MDWTLLKPGVYKVSSICRHVLFTEVFMCSIILWKIKVLLKTQGTSAGFVVSKWGVVLLLRKYKGNALLAQGSDPHSANIRHGLGRSSLLFCPSLNVSSSAVLAPFSPLGLSPLQGLFLHQKVPAKLAAESSGEGNERKGDSFLQDSLLKFLLKMKVKGAGRSFTLIVFPSFAHKLA